MPVSVYQQHIFMYHVKKWCFVTMKTQQIIIASVIYIRSKQWISNSDMIPVFRLIRPRCSYLYRCRGYRAYSFISFHVRFFVSGSAGTDSLRRNTARHGMRGRQGELEIILNSHFLWFVFLAA